MAQAYRFEDVRPEPLPAGSYRFDDVAPEAPVKLPKPKPVAVEGVTGPARITPAPVRPGTPTRKQPSLAELRARSLYMEPPTEEQQKAAFEQTGLPAIARGVTGLHEAAKVAQGEILPGEAGVAIPQGTREATTTANPLMLHAANELADGLLKASTPLLVSGAVAAPARTALAIVQAKIASMVGEKAAATVGASPEAQQLTGTVAALLSGTVSVTDISERIRRETKAVIEEAAKDATVQSVGIKIGPFTVKVGERAPAPPKNVTPGPRTPLEEPPPRDPRVAGGAVPPPEPPVEPPAAPAGEVIPPAAPAPAPGQALIDKIAGLQRAVADARAAGKPFAALQGQLQRAVAEAEAQGIRINARGEVEGASGEAPTGQVSSGGDGERAEAPSGGPQPVGQYPPSDVARGPEAGEPDLPAVDRLIARAQSEGYRGNPEDLRAELEDRLALLEELDVQFSESGRSPEGLLRAIADLGGISLSAETELKGELRRLKEFQDNIGGTRTRPRSAFGTVRGIQGVFREKGLAPDDIVRGLSQDPRFNHIENINDLLEEFERAARAPRQKDLEERFIRGLGGGAWWEGMRVTPSEVPAYEAPPEEEQTLPGETVAEYSLDDIADEQPAEVPQLEQLLNVLASGEQGTMRVDPETGKLVRVEEEPGTEPVPEGTETVPAEAPPAEKTPFEKSFQLVGSRQVGGGSRTTPADETTWSGRFEGKDARLRITPRTMIEGESYLTSGNQRLRDTKLGEGGYFLDVEIRQGEFTDAEKLRLAQVIAQSDSLGRPARVRMTGEKFRTGQLAARPDRLVTAEGPVDVLDTGEQQPNLLGAETVREQEVKTPEVATAPFSLEGETATTTPVEPTLFDPNKPFERAPRKGTPTRQRPPKTKAKVKGQMSPTEIVRYLSERLSDLPVRVGRFREQALGIYKRKAEVVRLRVANDLDTLAHEIGHHVDLTLTDRIRGDAVNAELEHLGAPTSRPSYEKWQVRAEGAAEFLRLYLSEPDQVKLEAPNYFQAFEEGLKKHPDLAATLKEAQRQYMGHLALDPLERVLSHVDFKGVDTPGKVPTLLDMETKWVDDLAVLNYAVQEMADGRPVDILEDAYRLARLARGAPGKADGFLRYGIRFKDGSRSISFEDVLSTLRKQTREFVAYLVSARSLELGSRGKKTGIPYEDARALVDRYGKAFKPVAAKIYEFGNAMLQWAEEQGLINASQRERMQKLNTLYVPFRRIMDGLDGYVSSQPQARRIANRSSPFKRYKGSGLDIINPLESFVRNMHALVDLAMKNDALKAIVKQSMNTQGGGRWIEKVPAPLELTRVQLEQMLPTIAGALEQAGLDVKILSGEEGQGLEVNGELVDLDGMVNLFTPAQYVKGQNGLITVIEDGKREFYQVNNLALYDAITAVGTRPSDLVVNLMMLPARAIRAGATLSIGFLGRNPVRDTFTAAVNTRYGFRPGVDTLRGLFHYLKADHFYQDFLDSGAANSAMVSFDRNKIREALHDMGIQKRQGFEKLQVVNPLNFLRALSEGLEQATRLGEFMRGMEQEPDTPSGRARAGLAARDVTIDFARRGTWAGEINRYTAFFNPMIQGVARIGEVFAGRDVPLEGRPPRVPPPPETEPRLPELEAEKGPSGDYEVKGGSRTNRALTALWRAFAAVTLPTLALWYINKDDKEYQELPAWEKLTYWHIPLGKGKGFAKIPTPFELFNVFGAAPVAALDWLNKKDPTIAKELFPDKDSAWRAVISVMPTAIMPAVETITNYDTFRDRPIVSPWELGLDTELQGNRWTSELAKDLGPKIGLAPAKFDHLIYGYFAGLGRMGVQTIDAMRGEVSPRAIRGLSDVPVAGELPKAFSRPLAGLDAQSIQDLYTTRDKLVGWQASARRYRAQNQEAKAMEMEENIRESGLLPSRVNQATDRMSDFRKELDQVWASTSLTPEEKLTRENRLLEQMVNTARGALNREPLPSRFPSASTTVSRP